jgi:hypothetical protein
MTENREHSHSRYQEVVVEVVTEVEVPGAGAGVADMVAGHW